MLQGVRKVPCEHIYGNVLIPGTRGAEGRTGISAAVAALA